MSDSVITRVARRNLVATQSEAPRGMSGDRLRIGPFLWLTVQLGLVLAVAVLYRLELENGFGVVAAVTFPGFLVHCWLPRRWKLPFFQFLTLVAIAVLLRWDGIWLVGVGLALLGLCHLPVKLSARVGLIFAAASGLAVLRAGWGDVSWAPVVIPLLGAMFMFRIILYLYDLKTDQTPASRWQRLAYFFMLPNVSFPLFPVVDYKTFLRSYYDAPAAEIYQKGVFWMLRGVIHLMLYRLVYLYFLPGADSDLSGALGIYVDLSGILGVYIFMAMTYALYLRVSGLFHLIVGSLCLFGFNLPPTNSHYFLASSFTDLWRRINIYWKDFMMTAVFYPVFMGVRRWGIDVRLMVATAAVFFVTWFLHSYQWFWLRGVFPITETDGAFWGVLGVALAANSVWESRRGRRRELGRQEWSWRQGLRVSVQTLGVFSAMAVLWTLWDSGSFSDWGYRLLRMRESTPREWAQFGALLGFTVVVGVSAQALGSRGWGLADAERLAWRHATRVVPIVAIAMLVVWFPWVHARVGGSVESAVILAKSTRSNAIDATRQERGYYETLSRTSWLNPISNELESPLETRVAGAFQNIDDVRKRVLVPNFEVTTGTTFTTNRWGLRDKDYEIAKPPGTYRIALIGASYAMGANVADDKTFENLVEDQLNRELDGRSFERYEILNFSVNGYGLLQTLYVAERTVPRFDADLVIYIVQPRETIRFFQRLRKVLNSGIMLGSEYEYLTRVLRMADAHGRMPESEFIHRLQPYQDDLLRWAFQRKVAAIRAQGALPVFLYMPLTGTPFEKAELRFLSNTSETSGAKNLFINDVFDAQKLEHITRSEWDDHPNEFGHRLIADRLYEELVESAVALGLLAPRADLEARPPTAELTPP